MMDTPKPFARGDQVRLRYGPIWYPAIVIVASPNGRSLILRFEAIVDGHVGVMPVLQTEDGGYVALMTNEPIIIERAA
jgi:hypothetical protein